MATIKIKKVTETEEEINIDTPAYFRENDGSLSPYYFEVREDRVTQVNKYLCWVKRGEDRLQNINRHTPCSKQDFEIVLLSFLNNLNSY